jgi:hypothetical protein
MSSPNNSSADNSNVNREREPDEIPPNRQEAFCRMFLYLKALHVPEKKAREFTREALQLAGRNQDDTASTSLPEAMRALRELLINQLPFLRKDPSGQHDAFLHENLSGLKSMPPVNRGFMVPAAIDLIPWRTFFVRSLKKTLSRASRPLNFLILFIFLIIVFVLLTFWK